MQPDIQKSPDLLNAVQGLIPQLIENLGNSKVSKDTLFVDPRTADYDSKANAQSDWAFRQVFTEARSSVVDTDQARTRQNG